MRVIKVRAPVSVSEKMFCFTQTVFVLLNVRRNHLHAFCAQDIRCSISTPHKLFYFTGTCDIYEIMNTQHTQGRLRAYI